MNILTQRGADVPARSIFVRGAVTSGLIPGARPGATRQGDRHPAGQGQGEAAAKAAADRPRHRGPPAAVETAPAPVADLSPKDPDCVSRFVPAVSDASTAA